MITCIANNGSNGQPEVPLWDCPCPTCTKLDWEALDSDRPSLGQHRHDGFPEQWDANGREILAPAFSYRLSHPQLSEPLEMDSHVERTDRALIAWATMYILSEFDTMVERDAWTVEAV